MSLVHQLKEIIHVSRRQILFGCFQLWVWTPTSSFYSPLLTFYSNLLKSMFSTLPLHGNVVCRRFFHECCNPLSKLPPSAAAGAPPAWSCSQLRTSVATAATGFTTIGQATQVTTEVKRSKFVATAFQVSDSSQALDLVQQMSDREVRISTALPHLSPINILVSILRYRSIEDGLTSSL